MRRNLQHNNLQASHTSNLSHYQQTQQQSWQNGSEQSQRQSSEQVRERNRSLQIQSSSEMKSKIWYMKSSGVNVIQLVKPYTPLNPFLHTELDIFNAENCNVNQLPKLTFYATKGVVQVNLRECTSKEAFCEYYQLHEGEVKQNLAEWGKGPNLDGGQELFVLDLAQTFRTIGMNNFHRFCEILNLTWKEIILCKSPQEFETVIAQYKRDNPFNVVERDMRDTTLSILQQFYMHITKLDTQMVEVQQKLGKLTNHLPPPPPIQSIQNSGSLSPKRRLNKIKEIFTLVKSPFIDDLKLSQQLYHSCPDNEDDALIYLKVNINSMMEAIKPYLTQRREDDTNEAQIKELKTILEKQTKQYEKTCDQNAKLCEYIDSVETKSKNKIAELQNKLTEEKDLLRKKVYSYNELHKLCSREIKLLHTHKMASLDNNLMTIDSAKNSVANKSNRVLRNNSTPMIKQEERDRNEIQDNEDVISSNKRTSKKRKLNGNVESEMNLLDRVQTFEAEILPNGVTLDNLLSEYTKS